MVCFCPIKKIIYIHIPKTGGITIELILIEKYGFKNFTFDKGRYEFLRDPRGKLGILNYILKYSKESKIYDLNSFYKFAFVRNPYDRSFSCLNYLFNVADKNNIDIKSIPLDKFFEMSRTDIYIYMHFNLTQSDCLRDLTGKINIDFIGRFENFQEDLEEVLFKRLSLKRINISRIHENKSKGSVVTNIEKVIKQINILHNDDFINFNYSFIY